MCVQAILGCSVHEINAINEVHEIHEKREIRKEHEEYAKPHIKERQACLKVSIEEWQDIRHRS